MTSIAGLMTLLVGVGFVAVWYAHAPLWFPLAFAVGGIVLQYLINPFVIQWLVRAKVIADRDGVYGDERLAAMVRRRCDDAGVPMVKLGLVDDRNPNAFTFGHHRGNARVWLTRGLIERLDEAELDAVIAHEVGHIKNNDFIVMTVAAVVPMAIYMVYLMVRDRRDGPSFAVAAGTYVAYWLSEFTLLSLSRARELAADHWSCATTGNGDALASALVKIAYGMGQVRAQEREWAESVAKSGSRRERKRAWRQQRQVARTASLRTMGIFDPEAADAMAVAIAGGIEPDNAMGAMRWDMTNPWARVLELLSSHPLVANRIAAMETSGLPGAPTTWSALRVASTADPEQVREARARFAREVVVMLAPYAVVVPLIGWGAFTGDLRTVGMALVVAGLLFLYKQTVRYPSPFVPVDSVASLLQRADAGPMAGLPVSLRGNIIGRGIPGYALSPDLVLEDDSGFVTLLYRQPIPFVATFFSIFRANRFMGEHAVARGWYRRMPTPVVELRDVVTPARSARAWMWWANYAGAVLLVLAGAVVALFGVAS